MDISLYDMAIDGVALHSIRRWENSRSIMVADV